MTGDLWRMLLIVGLSLNALSGFSYRLYRYRKGGPLGDVYGQAVLAAFLLGLAVAVAAGGDWARWPALAYAVVFAIVVMPIWTLAVLIPLPPGPMDYAFTALYWLTLVAIGASAVLL